MASSTVGSLAMAAPAPRGGLGLVEVPLADTMEPGALEVGLWSRWYLSPGASAFLGSPISATVGVLDDLECSLSYTLVGVGSPGWRPGVLDPLELAAKYRWLNEGTVVPGLALRLALLRADQAIDVLPELALQKTFAGHFKVSASAGYYGALLNHAEQRRRLLAGLGSELLLERWMLLIEGRARLDERDAYLGGEIQLSQRLLYHVGWGMHLAAGADLSPVGRQPYAQLVFGLVVNSHREQELDRDRDGLRDLSDRCVFEPEDLNGYLDQDGCPEGGVPKDYFARQDQQGRTFSTPRPRFRLKIATREMRHYRAPEAQVPLVDAPTEAARLVPGADIPDELADSALSLDARAPLLLSEPAQARTVQIRSVPEVLDRDLGLWLLAARPDAYGNARAWPLLYLANLDRLAGKELLQPDDELLVPRGLFNEPDEVVAEFHRMRRQMRSTGGPEPGTVRVVFAAPGETLAEIARRPDVYGDERYALLLRAANLDRLGGKAVVGQELSLRVPY